MFTRELYFIEQFVSEFRGTKYEIYKFVDPITMKIFYGNNLSVGNLEKGKIYTCKMDYKRANNNDSFIVLSAEEKKNH